MENKKSKNQYINIGAFAVMFAASLWALDMIVLRPRLYHLDVAVVVFLEHFIAFAFMLIPLIIEWKEIKKLNKKDWIAFIAIAILSGALGTMAITKALFYVNFVNLSVVAFLQKLQPIFAVIIAVILLKERPAKKFYFWSIIALIGSYFVTFGFSKPIFDFGDKIFMASLLSIIAAASFGSGTALSKYAIKKVNFRIGTYLRFGITSIVMFIILLVFGKLGNLSQVGLPDIGTLLIIAFSTGGIAIFIYYYGLKRISASVSTICELTFPFTAVIFEYIIRKNVLSEGQWLGAILLVVSVLAIGLGKNEVKELKK
jgi:drug/metabolite transporter (DMT)-like permease